MIREWEQMIIVGKLKVKYFYSIVAYFYISVLPG